MQQRSTLGPDLSVIAVIGPSQRTKQLIDVMFALKPAKLLHTNVIGVNRVGKRHLIMTPTYRLTA